MPRYFCPLINCNIILEGSVADIIPPAIGHAGGSHNTALTEEDVIALIQKQADPNYQKGKPEEKTEEKIESNEQPVKEISVPPVLEPPVSSELKGFTDRDTSQAIKDWWREIDKKL